MNFSVIYREYRKRLRNVDNNGIYITLKKVWEIIFKMFFFFFISGPRVNLAKLAQSSNNPQRTNIHLEPIFTEDPDIRA